MSVAAISPLIKESDKFFWHGFIDFYETHLAGRDPRLIVEFGVFKGNSVRWMLERFPNAHIDGVDILPIQSEWPIDPRVAYHQVDQGDRDGVRAFFKGRSFDLIVEDGSHIPQHHVTCLVEGFKTVKPGGLYILEDVHTSHPSHDIFVSEAEQWPPRMKLKGTALSTLLAIDHYRRLRQPLSDAVLDRLAEGNLMTREEIVSLDRMIERLWLYRRTHLPDRCYRCGAVDYRFHDYQCICGAEIFAEADSMTFVIERRGCRALMSQGVILAT